MQTKDTDPLSDPTLAKLLEVDSDLAAQEAKLLVQLKEIEEKRRSLKIVTSLFMPETLVALEAASLPPLVAAEEESPEPSLPDETSREAAAPKAKRPRALTRRTPGKQRTTSTPAGSRDWRPYVKKEFPATAALPEITFRVLHHLPERVFSVPELMSAIFVEEIPRDAHKTARSRLLALLSKGVKEQQWYRSNKGQYTSSAGTTEAAVDAPETSSKPESEIDNQQL